MTPESNAVRDRQLRKLDSLHRHLRRPVNAKIIDTALIVEFERMKRIAVIRLKFMP